MGEQNESALDKIRKIEGKHEGREISSFMAWDRKDIEGSNNRVQVTIWAEWETDGAGLRQKNKFSFDIGKEEKERIRDAEDLFHELVCLVSMTPYVRNEKGEWEKVYKTKEKDDGKTG